MRTQLKNTTAYGSKLRNMNDETYVLRRKVIDIIYSLKSEVELPRIEVRIVTEGHIGACGYAYLNKRIVHIVDKWTNNPHLYKIVLHEIVHAVTGFEHDNNCKLMSPYLNKELTNEEALKIFKTYFKG
jgi:hypothetical protein